MSEEFNLNLLKELEQEIVLNVLCRDEMLRKLEEQRVRKLKIQLQQLWHKGTKSSNYGSQKRSCARCQKSFGILIDRGAVCKGCSHHICSQCRITVNAFLWKCTVCYASEAIKVKTGEWFFEERAKKFPTEGRYETAGEKLLKSYQKLSKVSVIPPTPPPFAELTNRTSILELNPGFHKSMENLFLSLTTHIKKISKSQNDVDNEKYLLTANYGPDKDPVKDRRSLSDTAIDMSTRKSSCTNGEQDDSRIACIKASSDKVISSIVTNDALICADKKCDSLYSISSVCSGAVDFAKADVCGEIEFAIRYNFKFGILEVCISACKNLAYGKEEKKKCNPYVKTNLLPDKSPQNKRKTSVKKNTLNPTFQEILKYNIEYSQLQTRQLQISVWHAGIFRHPVFLGEVVIDFECWDFENYSTQSFNWYQLKAKVI
ncbi:synaptotagmin-like protein 3 [Pseudonaja textilis]|uniref:synaptotagmin-like protein 3 n=1 Tax=Pseudonaja textilis TaxID=8673 RepID=UPI000EAABEEE|nr:synaptotagmin-like protein 3 [Pseudonaja textilis]XP_026560849.1 synaptotagmin-like protein 3 [Pseudonaja textilis]XP_026560850.1 synaptotagmin-like protein 3 [Pseudonaja textilis]XP_026560851.1 synaptotagmin-like protein 3 [Pseudonaja textilis]XP_026560853.1 synaptotagmin-like protein 3 [Pseudonaja textilis]XP_026560854.1 synaptotagmin-like protein 3 [Pseudonaja textilis]XP_026560855.1 synaptotagmin-like protein 3 [Pseudonaja textilis]